MQIMQYDHDKIFMGMREVIVKSMHQNIQGLK